VTSPILRRAALLCLLALTAACSSGPGAQPQTEAPAPQAQAIFTPDRLLFEQGTDEGLAVYDPLEGLNRRIYNFNYQFDKYIFLPAVNVYKWVLPDFAETGVTNFFENFQDMTTAVNSLLQLNPEKFFQSTGRALVNTTLGVFGIFDVADTMDIPRPHETFGETLGYWGVGQGPYLVLPFLGPSNMRDGFGLLPDYYVFQYQIRKELWTKNMRTYGFLLEAVDARATTSFRYYENGSAFEYETVRRLWSTKREMDVAK
jgi:phospholipid-binding lipoprotein MlaA